MKDLRAERLQVMLSPDELAAVDDFRFKHRMPTRAAAVRELLKFGLAAVGVDAQVWLSNRATTAYWAAALTDTPSAILTAVTKLIHSGHP